MSAVRFSDHAHLKLEILKTHGILLDRELIEDVVLRPQKLEPGYGGRKIAQKGLDMCLEWSMRSIPRNS